MAADRAKVVMGVILLVGGIASCAVVTLILAVAVLLTTGFEWDGPILWDRVLGLIMCPAIVGTSLVPIGYSMATDRREKLK